jgi:hypothetical protein
MIQQLCRAHEPRLLLLLGGLAQAQPAIPVGRCLLLPLQGRHRGRRRSHAQAVRDGRPSLRELALCLAQAAPPLGGAVQVDHPKHDDAADANAAQDAVRNCTAHRQS